MASYIYSHRVWKSPFIFVYDVISGIKRIPGICDVISGIQRIPDIYNVIVDSETKLIPIFNEIQIFAMQCMKQENNLQLNS